MINTAYLRRRKNTYFADVTAVGIVVTAKSALTDLREVHQRKLGRGRE